MLHKHSASDTQNPLLSVYDLNILFQTAHINNAQSHSSLSQMNTELFNSEQPDNQRHATSHSYPTSELRRQTAAILSLLHQKTTCQSTPEISAFKVGAVKSISARDTWQNGSTEKAKFGRDNRKVFFFCSQKSAEITVVDCCVLTSEPEYVSPAITCKETLPSIMCLVE